MTNPLVQLAERDQSIWMDNLSRSILKSGELAELIEAWALKGITSNPAIFQKAIEGNEDYDAGIQAARDRGLDVNAIYESLVFSDITEAADIFAPIYRETNGKDGYISIEVSPKLAYNTEETVSEGARFFKTLERGQHHDQGSRHHGRPGRSHRFDCTGDQRQCHTVILCC